MIVIPKRVKTARMKSENLNLMIFFEISKGNKKFIFDFLQKINNTIL
ncbi:hypothetical protein LEP1GSC172_2906 [Leptospira noguchii]|uniref:Uncharacterized protein n=1 Tax=Leptospira noguchii TaxID=28182 RepID=M6VTC2_9LEPT|nr:hypothetical protein LEP1GSC172_2906 [Leptospira noguchii]